MQQHRQIGHDILSMSDNPVLKLAAEVALCHHEHWDGSGYPQGLKGDAIPEAARIVSLADVFDALTMKRPYKEAWPTEQAIGNSVPVRCPVRPGHRGSLPAGERAHHRDQSALGQGGPGASLSAYVEATVIVIKTRKHVSTWR